MVVEPQLSGATVVCSLKLTEVVAIVLDPNVSVPVAIIGTTVPS
jgi:hypothetical protein